MTTSEQWRPRPQWVALVRGERCPACAEVTSTEPANDGDFFVVDLDLSRLRLAANQFVTGYCVLLCHRDVCEPYELSRHDRSLFFEDMMRVGRALEQVFTPLKMNFNILGNAVPQLDAHILPRYCGDPAPHRPIDPNRGQVFLNPGEHRQRIELIRAALS